MLVKIETIRVKKRVRQNIGDIDALKESLRTYGLLNPITLTKDNELIAGERRLEAAKMLGWTNINAVILDNITPAEQLELELEENNQRKEFTKEELLEGYRRLERLRNPSIFMRIFAALQRFFHWFTGLFKKKV